MASLVNVENPEEDIPNAPVNKKALITQKTREITDCMEKCNQLRRELSALKNSCPAGGQCNWNAAWYGSHGIKTCSKCGREVFETSKGGRRRRKTRKTRKKKTKKRLKSRRRKRTRKRSKRKR